MLKFYAALMVTLARLLAWLLALYLGAARRLRAWGQYSLSHRLWHSVHACTLQSRQNGCLQHLSVATIGRYASSCRTTTLHHPTPP